jgi:hypothetical protein
MVFSALEYLFLVHHFLEQAKTPTGMGRCWHLLIENLLKCFWIKNAENDLNLKHSIILH